MNNTKIYKCDHCGIEETDDKRMQKCTGCNSSKILYCSRECQKLAWPSHKKRCRTKSNKASKLILNEKVQNFDLVLSYASRYMKNLKHVNISVDSDHDIGEVVISTEALQSFLQLNRGQLETFVWKLDTDNSNFICFEKTNGGKVWTELRGLKLLNIMHPVFIKIKDLAQVIEQQRDTILSLSLIGMLMGRHVDQDGQYPWVRNDCKALATSIGKCNNLVKLNLNQHFFRDSDLEILLPGLPRLQILDLCGHRASEGGTLTNKSCKIISRSCKELRELDLSGQDKITVAGLKKVFKSSRHLIMFSTSLDLSSKDAVELVCMAPSSFLSLQTEAPLDVGVYYDMIMATGGRVVPFNEHSALIEPDSLPKPLPREVITLYVQSMKQVAKRMRLDMTRPDLVNGWDEEHLNLWKQV